MNSVDSSATREGPREAKVQVVDKAEIVDFTTGAFSHSAVVFRDGTNLFHGTLPWRVTGHELHSLDRHAVVNVKPIPLASFPHFDAATFGTRYDYVPKNCYVKRPCLLFFSEYDTPSFSEDMLSEAKIFLVLEQHPHERICKFRGSFVMHGRVVGLCLQNYRATLNEVLTEGLHHTVQVAEWMRDVRNAVSHLHALGLCHNDVNPLNVMVDDCGHAILIDFDSCQMEGEELRKPGTFGWIAEGVTHSSKSNDIYAMEKLHAYLHESLAKNSVN